MTAGPRKNWNEDQKAQLVARIVSGALSVKGACETYGLSPECIKEWAEIYRRSVRHAIDDRLAQALERQGIEAAELTAAEFSGPLSEITISELLQTIEIGRKDGIITVTRDGMESRIWCANGEIVDAQSGRLSGLAAAYRVLGLERGDVCARFHPVTHQRTIMLPTQELLAEATRRKEEGSALEQRLGGSDAGYVRAAELENGSATLPADEQAIVQLCDGTRGLGEVISASSVGHLETLQVVARLVERKLLISVGPVHAPVSGTSSGGSTSAVLRGSIPPTSVSERPSVPYVTQALSRPSPSPSVAPSAPAPRGHTLALGALAVSLATAAALLVLYFGREESSAAIAEAHARQRVAAGATMGGLHGDARGEFAVDVRAAPERAEIWLDGKMVGIGRARLVLPRDGDEHHMRVLAAGYRTHTIIFTDAPPPRRVELEADQTDEIDEPIAEEAPRQRPAERSQPRRASKSRPSSTSQQEGSAAAAGTLSESPKPAVPSVRIIDSKKPNVQILE